MTNTHTLTVSELREVLAQYDGDMPVLFASKTGDYWGTVIASPGGGCEELIVEWNEYHNQYTVGDQKSDESGEFAVVIHA
jgi:hypothetical protein